MNTQVRNFLDALPVAAIVSNVKNNRIVYLNKAAKSYFKISEIDDKLTCQELLKLEGEDLKWYENVNLTSNIERFQVIYQNKNIPYPVLLDSSVLEYDGYQARLDVINTKNYDMIPDYNLYSNVFERSVNRLEKLYNSDMGLEGNIYQILDLVLYAYGGDRAFIYELDEELGCTVDLYERCRKGFMPYNDKYKSLDIITINNLMFKVKEYGFYSAVTEEMPESIIRDRMVDGLVVRNMGTQFPLRSGINCFLSIDNPRRFWGKSTFLKYAAFLLANEVHINKIQGYLDASYLLNKTINTETNRIKIYMFGGFEIQTSKGILQEGSFRSPQVCVLISFLLMNRRRMLSIYEISNALWPGQVLDNPYNQIKNVVFRARKALEGVCEKPLIEAGGGTYFINREVDVWVDTEEFERLCRKASREDIPTEQRLSLYDQAFLLYRGSMLPFMEPELWLLTTINYYQILYTQMTNEYVKLLSKTGEFTRAFAVASETLNIEPSNYEIYSILLESLIENNHEELARKYYQQIYVHLSKKQKEHFRQIWKRLSDHF
jgi:two-component SAPR family response regulator